MDKNTPQPATFDVQQDYTYKKKELELAFKEFHELVSNKVLSQNKSAGVKNTEKQTVDRLVKAAVALDNINVGEGILALATIAIREQLIVRDRVNTLEYEMLKLARDFEEFKKRANKSDGS